MTAPPAILGGARSAVVPRHGAFAALAPHEIAAPVVQALLRRAGVPAAAVDVLLAGNALGAGGNPARVVALAAGLPERCAALSVDTQCCAGLDAVTLGAALIAGGQAELVVAGGVEAWSRSPIRMHRPRQAGEAPVAYERPAFAPEPARDPDLLASAARHAARHGWDRRAQDAYALASHARALAARERLRDEIVTVAGVTADAYPRRLDARRAARLPLVHGAPEPGRHDGDGKGDHDVDGPPPGLGLLTVSPQADGAAFVLLASADRCAREGWTPRAHWQAGVSVGGDPRQPLTAAALASEAVLARAGRASDGLAGLAVVELHDAFAVQGLDYGARLGRPVGSINPAGGGLARGHPIGASGAVALVRVLAELQAAAPGAAGLAAIAAAGGLGAAALVVRAGWNDATERRH